VQAVARSFDLNVYYTVTARYVVATYDIFKDEKPINGGSLAEARTLEVSILLHGKSDEEGTWEFESILYDDVNREIFPFRVGAAETEMIDMTILVPKRFTRCIMVLTMTIKRCTTTRKP
jgi:hypothetical protein